MYLSVYVYLVPTTSLSPMKVTCVLKEWLFTIGYSMCFGTVLSRMWRIYKIFHNPTPKKKLIKDRHLLIIVASIVSTGIGLLLLETAVPQLIGDVVQQKDSEDPSGVAIGDIQVNYSLLVCYKASSLTFYWKILIFIYLAMLQIIGIMLAFQTRRVKYKELRDSKFVAIIIYVSSLILLILAIDTFLLNTYLNAYGAIFSLGIIILTTTFLLLTFVPKMFQVYQNQDTFPETTLSTVPFPESKSASSDRDVNTQVSFLQETLQEKENAIALLEKEISELKEKLNVETKNLEEVKL